MPRAREPSVTVGSRDAAFPLAHGRGDHVTDAGGSPDPRELPPKGLRAFRACSSDVAVGQRAVVPEVLWEPPDQGLEQDFNSLDAQREASEAYIKSQAHEGWRLIRGRYDDGGYSGGSMDRPALQKLLADVEAKEIMPGRADCLVERDGFEPEISLAVLPRTQPESLVRRLLRLGDPPRRVERPERVAEVVDRAVGRLNWADSGPTGVAREGPESGAKPP
jgi:hypothetical protein